MASRGTTTTPAGGSFRTFGAPAFAPNGEVYFSAQYAYGNGTRAGIFAGLPGNLRKIITTFDPIGTSICGALDRSRNPFTWIGRSGEIVLWTRIQHADQSFGEALVRVRANGVAESLAEPGSPGPTGGVIAELGRFPSIDASGRVLQSARIASAQRRTRSVLGTLRDVRDLLRGQTELARLHAANREPGPGIGGDERRVRGVGERRAEPSHRLRLLRARHGRRRIRRTLCATQPLHRVPADEHGTVAVRLQRNALVRFWRADRIGDRSDPDRGRDDRRAVARPRSGRPAGIRDVALRRDTVHDRALIRVRRSAAGARRNPRTSASACARWRSAVRRATAFRTSCA